MFKNFSAQIPCYAKFRLFLYAGGVLYLCVNYMKKETDTLCKKLRDSVAFLENTVRLALQLECTDPLRSEYAIAIATKLRVLLNDEGRNTSLTNLLKIKDHLVFTAIKADPLANIPANMVFTSILTSINIKSNTAFYCVNKFSNVEDLLYTFDAWWNEIVIDSKYEQFSQISRRDVILTLADKEGGAHVDESYDIAHYQATQSTPIKCIDSQGKEIAISNDVYTEAALYIAQEFINAYRIYTNLHPQTYERSESKYKIFQLIYYRQITNGKKTLFQKRYRFLRYTHGNPNNAIMFFFDYYQLAEYRLLDLYRVSKFYPNEGMHSAVVINIASNSHRIVYARTPNCEQHVILWKNKDAYKIINTETDFNNTDGFASLDEITKQLYPSEPKDFDEYFTKQIMVEME